jgi:ABC-type phosphate/phosphonate transport system ATPase subunit
MLAIEGLTVRYGKGTAPALRELSLSVAAGERVALVGPSGSGKTTLFRAISGFVPAEAGRIVIAGTEIGRARGRRLRAMRRGIGVIAQQHDLCASCSGRVMSSWRKRVRRWNALGWPRNCAPVPANSRAASSSAWQSRAPWCNSRW